MFVFIVGRLLKKGRKRNRFLFILVYILIDGGVIIAKICTDPFNFLRRQSFLFSQPSIHKQKNIKGIIPGFYGKMVAAG
jgi:hypothetical protein